MAHRPATNRGSFRICLTGLTALLLLSAITAARVHASDHERSSISSRSSSNHPAFVGSRACGVCHAAQFKSWQGSHHQLAMQSANDATVLGDFNNAHFVAGVATSSFFKRDKKFFVRTDGPDGVAHDYEISFTFGVFPLQQYLITTPGGRLQAYDVAWDARSRDVGGQRWFTLYPGVDQSAPSPLHWTAIDQNWNYMCADCHSTGLHKNYNDKTRSYETSYAEVNVACEACHGPGANHLAWARKSGNQKKKDTSEGLTILLDDRRGAAWVVDPVSKEPRRSKARVTDRELEMCARCHSRRSQIHEDYVHGQPIEDDYRVALLDPDLYFVDGQIKGEVYEYGSFVQSRMFHEGVTCSDCHDPHSSKLRIEGNGVCLQCHLSAKYDSPSHHFHKSGTRAAQCVECHMPTRTYMMVDARRDHSIRIPRPDLSITLGTPNACNQCHINKSAQWSSDTLMRWYGHHSTGFQSYAETINDGRNLAPGAPQELEALSLDVKQPPIVRATGLNLLSSFEISQSDEAIKEASRDASPMVRRAAANALSTSALQGSAQVPASLLKDPVRGVRIEAAEALASRSPGDLPSEMSTALEHATNEWIAAQELNADRPEAHLNLARLFEGEGQIDRAESELKTAIALDPGFPPAAVNLADLYRERGQDSEGEAVLASALQRSPRDASLLHSLGLLMIRQKKNTRALELLAAAARSEPNNARYSYVYAVALHDSGNTSDAIRVLEESIKSHPYDRDMLTGLTEWWNEAGDRTKATAYGQRLNQLGMKADR